MSEDETRVLVSLTSEDPDKQRLLNVVVEMEENRIKEFFQDLIKEHSEAVNLEGKDSLIEISYDPEAFEVNENDEGVLPYMINTIESDGDFEVSFRLEEKGYECTVRSTKNPKNKAKAFDSEKFMALVSAANAYDVKYKYHPVHDRSKK